MYWQVAYYAFLVLPVSLWFLNRLLLRNSLHWLIMWPVAIVGCYSVLLLGVHLLDSHLEAELYKHDLDGDRTFSGSEITPEMEQAAGRLTNDTGRALAPITGIPISLIWVSINYIPLGLVSLAIWRFRAHRGDFDSVEIDMTPEHSSVQQDPDGIVNPYQPPGSIKRVG
ncbi:MAG: hypothetical protein MUC43_08870 [Pirellula sp.]|jgi:hypothetical protein|nr:hypothetical protein [Pirellula sp.]